MANQAVAVDAAEDIDLALGQKLMLDFRYFCYDSTASEQCRQPVKGLTPEIADILVSGKIGGVILFSENLHSIEQIVTLNYQLQALMARHGLPPLFIAIDQEGGRVARLDASIATRFVGNMAIGATYPEHGTQYASRVGVGLGRAIKRLGFNVNFAPTVDVNVNPDNPVINVRSYGEDPKWVAELGAAAVAGMQSQQIISALKHFPGHGDTHIDSHTGLPRVEHSKSVIEQVDLAPFRHIIAQEAAPGMIMTAHIQYPQLDNQTFTALNGEKTILPATMSKAILTGLLRQQMGYQGVIVTDALDMAGIAHYFDPAGAVVQTFNAGADIALMPYRIRNASDIKGFWKLRSTLQQAVVKGELSEKAMMASARRIAKLKEGYSVGTFLAEPLSKRIHQARGALPDTANQQLERELARDALTLIYDSGVLPLEASGHWQAVMPDQARCEAFEYSANKANRKLTVSCLSLATIPADKPWVQWAKADALIIGDISPQHSVVEMGGMDDLNTLKPRANKTAQYQWMQNAMQAARSKHVPVILVALRAPYVASQFTNSADAALTTYGYNVDEREGQMQGAVFDALVLGMLGLAPVSGSLPVSVRMTD
ncbi:glycoside hydrolase family 3 protein [Alteromonas aestuariivivens]|nr:glycoside hydrolase family 3 protein [Alteromonas aestuariivivens]